VPGGTIDPPTPLGPDSQTNWDASKIGSLVQVTAAEFDAAMAAMSGTRYGFPEDRFANTTTSKGTTGSANANGVVSTTFNLTQPLVTTSVPAGNYIIGIKVRVNTLAARNLATGFMSLITANDTTALPFGDRKLYADLGHNLTIIPIAPAAPIRYEYFLIKGDRPLTTTRVGSYLWSYADWAMSFGLGGSYTNNRQFSPATALTDSGAASALLMMQTWATPTKSW
jgi:hypothetical protein